MDLNTNVKYIQESAVASWINYLNQLRLDELIENLQKQDVNLACTLKELDNLKKSIGEVIKVNRGGKNGIHGFIGERMQVGLENAKRLIDGLEKEYTLIDDNGPIDYFKGNIPIQQKARKLFLGIPYIKEHFQKYPDFIKKGGVYEIPKDFYEELSKLWNLSENDAKLFKNSNHERYLTWKAIQRFKKDVDIPLEKIRPMVVSFDEIQSDQYMNTIKRKEVEYRKKDKLNRDLAYEKSKPTVNEMKNAAKVGAGVEAAVALGLAVAKKHKEGKKIVEYEAGDWKDIGIDTSKGAVKGGIRAGVVYGLSNFTCTPGNVASALVTATYGTIANAIKYSNGEISDEDFIINSEACCLDVGVSTVSAILGEVVIPIPVLGAVIGTTIGNYMYEIVKKYCDENTKKCIEKYYTDINELNKNLNDKLKFFVDKLQFEFRRFTTIMELAFDYNVNVAFDNSVILAELVGVNGEKILRNEKDIDDFFM